MTRSARPSRPLAEANPINHSDARVDCADVMFEYERLELLVVYGHDASKVVRPEEVFKEGLEVTERDAIRCD